MEKLWAPWRIEYIRAPGPDEGECIFCDNPKKGNDRESLILHRGVHTFIVMNLYPYNNAHLMVVPYRHVETTHDLTREELQEAMLLADSAMTILKSAVNAQGFNFGANIGVAAGAGIADHIHFHIVPRWIGDTNFMPVLGHTKVLIQGLLETYDNLKPSFDELTPAR